MINFEFDEYLQYDPNLKLVAAATISELPENAVVFTYWDMIWPYYHIAHLQNSRTDLTFIETLPADDQDVLADSLIAYVVDNVGDRPIFFEERYSQVEQLDDLMMSPVRRAPHAFLR